MGALAAFDAAARLGGFTRAAGELGVTQAAISRQIRALEDDLGKPLFVRSHRQVVLTNAGRLLADAVAESFARMADAIEQVREGRDPETLTVSTSLAFSHFWLLPRLPSFRAANPTLKLRVLSTDNGIDLRQGDADVVIRYGNPPFRDGAALADLGEVAYPVASLDFARSLPGEVADESLATLPLIEADAVESLWLTWPQWFARAGIDQGRLPTRGMLTFNHYSDAVYAAISGAGIVLGWHRLLHRPLSDGRLTRIGTAKVEPQERHHVVVAHDTQEVAAVIAFLGWIKDEFTDCP